MYIHNIMYRWFYLLFVLTQLGGPLRTHAGMGSSIVWIVLQIQICINLFGLDRAIHLEDGRNGWP
jgi:hypothetical protein